MTSIHRLAFGSQESLPEYPTVGDQGVSPEALSPEGAAGKL